MPREANTAKGEHVSTDIRDGIDSLHGLIETLSHRNDEPGDESLIQALADGAVWAMDLLYQRYSGLLYSFALRMVADHQVAEDLLQEVFLAVWRHATSYAPHAGTVHGWLMSIMHHRAIDYLRAMRRRGALNEISLEGDERDEGAASSDVWNEVWRSAQSSLVRECLMELVPEQRVLIELAYFQGWTQREMAEACEIPLGTVKARIRLGLLHLKRELEKRGLLGI